MDFETWARAHTPRLLRVATLLTGRRAEAEDLVQDVLLVTYQRWESIAAMERPWAYVVRTLTNRHLANARSNGRELRRMRLHALTEISCMPEELGFEPDLAAALAGLGPRQRAVLLLRHVDDISDDDIAAALRCSVATVRSQASRALALLRSALTPASTSAESRQP
ncbi:RNA polymerase sigma factor (sigma-70 family) [Kineosphaera limosa]|nr:sigma-70 family RNA polymerase sigma factor [Kineosphaera limosa]NYD98970.1 RNA polymerase sigma factor (sigma-70 family) [Kineosphaera limosa]